jgi:hypothetical protein
MDAQFLLTAGLVVLVGGALLVMARFGAAAAGLLPWRTRRERETAGNDPGTAGSESAATDERTHITDDDCERMRRHLRKSRGRRSPDDLLPSADEESDPEES